jgi:hypothetical protein
MLEKLSSFSIIAFLLSFGLGTLCLYYILRILINKRIVIKVMEESLGEAATSPSIISLVCVVLGLFAAGFFAVCIGIYFYIFGFQ